MEYPSCVSEIPLPGEEFSIDSEPQQSLNNKQNLNEPEQCLNPKQNVSELEQCLDPKQNVSELEQYLDPKQNIIESEQCSDLQQNLTESEQCLDPKQNLIESEQCLDLQQNRFESADCLDPKQSLIKPGECLDPKQSVTASEQYTEPKENSTELKQENLMQMNVEIGQNVINPEQGSISNVDELAFVVGTVDFSIENSSASQRIENLLYFSESNDENIIGQQTAGQYSAELDNQNENIPAQNLETQRQTEMFESNEKSQDVTAQTKEDLINSLNVVQEHLNSNATDKKQEEASQADLTTESSDSTLNFMDDSETRRAVETVLEESLSNSEIPVSEMNSDALQETETYRIVESITEEQMEVVGEETADELLKKLADEIKNEPIVSYATSESDVNEEPRVTDIIFIEEIKENIVIEQSSSTSPQLIPIVIEQEEKTDEEGEVSEKSGEFADILVLESVDEGATINLEQTTKETITVQLNIEQNSAQKLQNDVMEIQMLNLEVSDGGTNNAENINEENIVESNTNETVLEVVKKQKSDELMESIYVVQEVQDKKKAEPELPQQTRFRRNRDVIQARRKEDDVLVPCHLLGRSVDNPTEDLISNGRTPPKPRLGVKVPYRFLTSQIVSKQEIADELLELTSKRNPSPEPPIGGDIFFAKKLTQRLANKIAMNETKKLQSGSTVASGSKQQTAMTPPPPAPAVLKTEAAPKPTPEPKSAINDNLDLLAILEGNVEVDWAKEVEQRDGKLTPSLAQLTSEVNAEKPTSVKVENTKKIFMDPEMERLIALKQLKELPKSQSPRRRGRKPGGYSSIKYQKEAIRAGFSKLIHKESTSRAVAERTSKIMSKESKDNVKSAFSIIGEKAKDKKLDQSLEKTFKEGKLNLKDILEDSTKTIDKTVIETENVIAEIEPVLTPKRVMKTYSRKETLLQVPRDLEYIVNESEIESNTSSKEETTVDEKKEEEKQTSTSNKNRDMNIAINTDDKALKKDNKLTDVVAKKPKKIAAARKHKIEINKPEVNLVSKRARIIKKKVIWDPAEAPKAVRTPSLKKSEKLLKEKEILKKAEKSLSNNEIEDVSEQLGVLISKSKKNLPKANLSKIQNSKKLIIQRHLRSLPVNKLNRTSNRKLQKSALLKKTKQALLEMSKKAKPKKTELDKLLMDEGAVNMLYSVRRNEQTAEIETKRKKSSVISLDRAQKDLITRMRVVKDVITQSSNQEDSPKALRKKDSPVLNTVALVTVPPRKKSRDSIRSSLHSPPPSPSYIYSHRAEASRIIRRHSSSFSSECSSPRRLSIDNQQQQEQLTSAQLEQQSLDQLKPPEPVEFPVPEKPKKPEVPVITRVLRRKGVPIYERSTNEKTYKGKKELMPETESLTTAIKEKLTLTEKRKINTEMSKNFSKQSPRKRTRQSKTAEDEDEKNQNNTEESQSEPEEKEKITTRQVSVSTSYKEISLKKIDSLVQIVMTPTSTKLKNPINLQMFQELCDVLSQLTTDDTCRVALITSTTNCFCHGVDFSTLIQPSAEKRVAAAREMAEALKNFLRALATFPKPLVAGVQGSAVGLGVTMLPLFDLVLASDKATFSTPYGQLGQIPEGLVSLTLPHLSGNMLISELLFANRKLTASEALQHGLITRTLWPDKFQEELISSALAIAGQSSQCIIGTKALLRQSLLSKLDEALDSENKLLIEHWVSAECQQNFKRLLQADEWC